MRLITVDGNLGRDAVVAESKFSDSMKQMTFSIASKEYYDVDKDNPIWYTVYAPYHERMLQYLKKGTYAIVSGKYKERIVRNNEGNLVIYRDILDANVMFGKLSKSDNNEGGGQTYTTPSYNTSSTQSYQTQNRGYNTSGNVPEPYIPVKKAEPVPSVAEEKLYPDVEDDLPF